MFKYILKLLGKPLFKDTIEWKIDYIKDNIDKITIDSLYDIEIKTIINHKHKSLNLVEITKLIIDVRKLVDETNNTIPNEMAIGSININKRMIDYLTINNKLNLNYSNIILELFIEYTKLKEIYNTLNENDIIQEYNSKIIDIYIINMDRIIQSLYEVIDK